MTTVTYRAEQLKDKKDQDYLKNSQVAKNMSAP